MGLGLEGSDEESVLSLMGCVYFVCLFLQYFCILVICYERGKLKRPCNLFNLIFFIRWFKINEPQVVESPREG